MANLWAFGFCDKRDSDTVAGEMQIIPSPADDLSEISINTYGLPNSFGFSACLSQACMSVWSRMSLHIAVHTHCMKDLHHLMQSSGAISVPNTQECPDIFTRQKL